jgi:hypothetical protein
VSKPPDNELARPMRRSTRINEAVQLKVTGIDSYRGPYSEQVATDTISCHGFKFKSKYDVLIDSEVMLELKKDKQEPLFARGVVKWLQRPGERDQNSFFQTAIELEEPGNIWSVASPPEDWLLFSHPRKPVRAYVKPILVAPQSALPTKMAVVGARIGERTGGSKSAPALPSGEHPLGQFMAVFQRQMEEMLSAAVSTAVQREAVSMRDGLRAEAKNIIAEVAAAHIDKHNLQLEQSSQKLSAKLIEQLGSSVEACRRDAVDRIVTRLKEQLAKPVEDARKVTSDLTRAKEDLEGILGDFTLKTSIKIGESCTRFENQFETAMRERLGAASAEVARASQSTMLVTLENLRVSASEHEARAQGRLKEAIGHVSESALITLKQKSEEISRQSTEALTSYSCRHLEFFASALSELAHKLVKTSMPS